MRIFEFRNRIRIFVRNTNIRIFEHSLTSLPKILVSCSIGSYEPRYEKTGFLHMRKQKMQISFAVTAKLISAFVFATRILQSLYFLNLKFQASSYLLWLYGPVCVGSGRKPRRPVFSQRDSYCRRHLGVT